MKRDKSLAHLSREHHFALVIAKRARGAAGEESRDRLVAEVIEKFAQDLESHFRVEEGILLPHLKRAGQGELVARTLMEHAHLRRLVGELAARDEETLHRFGDVLKAHVRFEERELFPVAESVLSPETLEEIHRHVEAGSREG